MTFFWLFRWESSAAWLIAVFALGLIARGGEAAPTDRSFRGASPSADTIEVTMTDHAYDPSTLTVPAGEPVTLQFANDGTVEHYFVVGASVASDKEGFEQNLFEGVSIEKNKRPGGHADEEGSHDEGGDHEEEEGDRHENEFELPPGGSGSMTFTLPASKAGTYTIACFETTGGQKHYEMGMEGTLRVTTPDDE
ncbi:cupredoxin domain-containing protein [Salinibacter grassmerensis]|uniref:cupredoxin domain-containing protein n=1 Tax=Salinibacter grassmerensis TaxID=3040353 RepID=UPI0021E8CC2A|nr:cupredoxin domain-containing protein [Salinibacter grassmerensis]